MSAIKLIQERIPQQVDVALAEHVRSAESWATKVRLWFAVTSVIAAGWMWEHHSNVRMIYLILAAVWLLTAIAVGALARSGASESLVSKTTLLDLTIVHLGLAAFVQQGLFPKLGAGVFLCYFPILAVAANRYRMMLVVQSALYAMIGYGLISYLGGSPPWFRLSLLAATAFVFAMGSHKPKDLVVNVAKSALQEAYDLGASQRESDLTAQVHQLFLPPPIVDLPAFWSSSKHGAGTESGGDYYQIFDTARGPLVVVGDLSVSNGKKFEALTATADLHKTLSRIISQHAEAPNLTKILEALNADSIAKQRRFTCVLAQWQGEQLHYVNAGHLPLIHLNKPQGAQTAGHKQLPVTCGAVGEKANAVFTESAVPFPARDLLMIYTDGAFAKLTDDREKGIAEIEAMAERFSGGEVTTLCHRVYDCAQPGLEPIKDDATVVVIRRQPAAAAAGSSS
ncbi:MAG TPA: PP2C family protein-serine/threonine phosphatase [Blastocatellia bacterium]|nr:PP2C family protein-serine/threonine phosphatase [Blastocatellia bacterium]HMV87313.1 PP2C family protein-serine/threonine phosphatase [Blastocatellia bacterium]HMZ18935.1 PP2C family protein-serine/threonine phosphatase [Blastocatellia bacterium]HNG32436.1 PP2C family protein-serine/threonine phosphatase [Blastocatellia bacterium]